MITDKATLNSVNDKWSTVLKFRDRRLSFPTFAETGFVQAIGAPNEFLNLPLVLAYGVLDDVMKQMKDENLFVSKKGGLKNLMEASRPAVPWLDYDKVLEGYEARNFLAHEAILYDAPVCIDYINAVGRELQAWKIIP